LSAIISELHADKEKLHGDLEAASTYMHELEDKVYQANKKCLDLLRQIKETEETMRREINHLQAYIIELKSRLLIYIPHKDDALDKKLAEFINNYPNKDKVKILFQREKEGVYMFGSMRVLIEQDVKQKLKVRVGGGLIPVDQFLDQYTPQMLDHMKKNDILVKLNDTSFMD